MQLQIEIHGTKKNRRSVSNSTVNQVRTQFKLSLLKSVGLTATHMYTTIKNVFLHVIEHLTMHLASFHYLIRIKWTPLRPLLCVCNVEKSRGFWYNTSRQVSILGLIK